MALRAMTPEQRLKIAFDLSEMERQVAPRQLARAFPELSELEIKRLYLGRLIKRELRQHANESSMSQTANPVSRRELLCRCGMGFGALALADLMGQAGLLTSQAMAARAPIRCCRSRRRCRPRPSGSFICS